MELLRELGDKTFPQNEKGNMVWKKASATGKRASKQPGLDAGRQEGAQGTQGDRHRGGRREDPGRQGHLREGQGDRRAERHLDPHALRVRVQLPLRALLRVPPQGQEGTRTTPPSMRGTAHSAKSVSEWVGGRAGLRQGPSSLNPAGVNGLIPAKQRRHVQGASPEPRRLRRGGVRGNMPHTHAYMPIHFCHNERERLK